MAQNVNPTSSRIHDQADKDALSRSVSVLVMVSKKMSGYFINLSSDHPEQQPSRFLSDCTPN